MQAEIKVPTDINEIPLKSYLEFVKVVKNSNDEKFMCEKMVQIFCGIRLKNVFYIKWSDIQDIVIHLNKLFAEKPKFENTFTIQGVKFGFIPNKLEDISFGEYIDLENNLKDLQDLNKALAVMYRPVTLTKGDKYQIENYESTANYSQVMNFCPLGIALAAHSFFFHLTNDLLISTRTYLKKQMTNKELTKALADEPSLTNIGAGTLQYTQLVKKILDDLERLPGCPYTSALPSLVLKSKKQILSIANYENN